MAFAKRPRLAPVVLKLLGLWLMATAPAAGAADTDARRTAVVKVASRLLDEAEVSYVYGGHQLGDSEACNRCNTCLEKNQPRPQLRLKTCPICQACSLDCSHFTELVFRQAGVPYPYLDTARMLSLPPAALRHNYQLLDLGLDLSHAAPGDLLVYDGHVVLLERVYPRSAKRAEVRGDILHATGGREIRRPGEGIQRERFADLAFFRGPLRRLLRHVQLAPPALAAPLEALAPRPPTGRRAGMVPAPGKLRPVAKVAGDDG